MFTLAGNFESNSLNRSSNARIDFEKRICSRLPSAQTRAPAVNLNLACQKENSAKLQEEAMR